MYCYLVHIDGHAPFVYEVMEDRVHHGLEGGWGVGKPEEHDGQLI